MRPSFLIWIGLAAIGAGCGREGGSPLIGAVRRGDVTQTRQLLNSGADPNRREGVNNWTPLMHAVHKNQTGTARVLIEGGAEVDARGPHEETALMMAAGYGQEEMVRLLGASGWAAARRDTWYNILESFD